MSDDRSDSFIFLAGHKLCCFSHLGPIWGLKEVLALFADIFESARLVQSFHFPINKSKWLLYCV